MLLEDLLSLPVGTRVLGEIELPTKLTGLVAKRDDGSHFIRWDDGYSTIPLGKVREYDEYIAAHTELVLSREEGVVYAGRPTATYQGDRPSQVRENVPPDWVDPVNEECAEVSHA